MKRLTDGQKKARAAVRVAAKALIAEVDRREWLRDCVEFHADLHLSGTRFDKAQMYGKPCAMSFPVYRFSTAK